MHGRARVRLPDIAAGPHAVAGDGLVADDVQPKRFPCHPQAGLVHARHRDGQGLSPLVRGLRRQPCGRAAAEGLDRARRQRHSVQFPQPRHRQVLGVAQVGRLRLQTRAEAYRSGHVRGEGRPRPGPAAGAAHRMRPVLGHGQGRRHRQVVHWAPGHGCGIRAGQNRTTTTAPRRPVVHSHVDPVRSHRVPGGPRMARLAARPAAPRPAPAARARRGLGSVLRGRWAAVAAVPVQLTAQLRQLLVLRGHPRTQRRQLALQGLHRHHQPRHHRMADQGGVGRQLGDAVGEGRGGHDRSSVAQTATARQPRQTVRWTEPRVPEWLRRNKSLCVPLSFSLRNIQIVGRSLPAVF